MDAMPISQHQFAPTATFATARRPAPLVIDEADDILRDHFADGWDSDDAMLGWVDETMVGRRARRLH